MRQKKLQTVAALINGATKASAGAAQHEATLELVVGTKLLIDRDLNVLILAANNCLVAGGELAGLRRAQRARVKVAYDLAFVVRDSLKRTLGRIHSTEWDGTGFERSLKVPRSVAPLQQLLRSLKSYLTAHPEAEIANVATVSLVESALNRLVEAVSAVTVQSGKVKTLLVARHEAEKKMRLRLRGLAEELNRVVGPLDGRWEAFGLNQPGIKEKPAAPEELSVEEFRANGVRLKWKPTPRADYYRVWFRKKDAAAEFECVGRPSDPDFSLKELPAGSETEIAVSAVNSGGESVLSQIELVQTEAVGNSVGGGEDMATSMDSASL